MKYCILLLGLYLILNWNDALNKQQSSINLTKTSLPLSGTCNPEEDFESLLILFDSLNGENWDLPGNPPGGWTDPNIPIGSWHGITSLVSEDCVRCINLNRFLPMGACEPPGTGDSIDVFGQLPSPFGFPALEVLYITNNRVFGGIPDFSCSPNLEILQLDHNFLTGSIPSSLLANSALLELHLQNNQLSGAIPEDIMSNLPLLNEIVLNNNKLSGIIPNFRTTRTIRTVNLSGNRFTFEHILPNYNFNASKNTISNFTFFDQDSIFANADTVLHAAQGYPITIDLGIDKEVPDNNYKWFRNRVSYKELRENKITIPSVDTTTYTYHCDITNDRILADGDDNRPHLTLHSRLITVSPCIPVIKFIDTLLCPGDSLVISTQAGTDSIFNAGNPVGYILFDDAASNGCDYIIDINIQYYPPDVEASAEAEATFTCQPELLVQGNEIPFSTGFWHSPNSLLEFEDSIAPLTTVQNLQPGQNIIVWHQLHDGCQVLNDADTLDIFYQPEFQLLDETFTLVGQRSRERLDLRVSDSLRFLQNWQLEIITPLSQSEMQLDITTGIIWHYERLDPCPGQDSFQYQLVNEDCVYSDIATVQFNVEPPPRNNNDIPDVITPNNDGLNDTFIIPGIQDSLPGFEVNRLIIFNKWGNVLLDQRNYQNDWDGDGLPAALYYFRFQLGEQIPVDGQITIIR